MMTRSVVVILLLDVVVSTSVGDDPKTAVQDVKFHRRAAGAPGKDGWYEARSTGGNFSVMLPCPFNNFTASGASREGGRIALHVIGTVTTKSVKYSPLSWSLRTR